jgi:hypothetical protein
MAGMTKWDRIVTEGPAAPVGWLMRAAFSHLLPGAYIPDASGAAVIGCKHKAAIRAEGGVFQRRAWPSSPAAATRRLSGL